METLLLQAAHELQRLMLARNYWLASAESCTGGMLASLITAVPGASGYFYGSFVTYTAQAKTLMLGIPEDVISQHGVVSPEVAELMAYRARKLTSTDITVSITGIAGPGGGTEKLPVGLVYIGFAMADGVTVQRHVFEGTRDHIQKQTCLTVFDYLIQELH